MSSGTRWVSMVMVNYYLPRDWIARGVIAGQYSDEALIAGETIRTRRRGFSTWI